jgi:hypothetical protein
LVLLSTDNGAVWREDFAGTAYNLFGLSVFSDSIVWICGDNGSILALLGDGNVNSVNRTGEMVDQLARDFHLDQNYPNPFNPTTLVSYSLPRTSDVVLAVYDILGREVAVLAKGVQTAGRHQIEWRGGTSSGRNAAAGVYLLRLTVDGVHRTVKMSLLR